MFNLNFLFGHFQETIKLGFPIIIARTSILLMVTVDAMMTGWAGSDELAYLGIGLAPGLTLMIISIGALQATVVLSSQAVGSNNIQQIGGVWRVSLLHSIIFSIIAIICTLYVEQLFLITGQDAVVSKEGAKVAIVFAFGIPGMLLFVSTNLILESLGYPKVAMCIMLAANGLNIILNGIFVLSWGNYFNLGGAYEAVLVSSSIRWAVFLAAFIYLIWMSNKNKNKYNIIVPLNMWIKQLISINDPITKKFRKISLPMSFTQAVESVAFGVMVFIAGLFGTNALAAHQACFTIMSLVYMLAIGMAGATSIRVGKAVGMQNVKNTQVSGFVGLIVAAFLTLPFTFFAVFYPETIARIFFIDIEIINLTAQVLIIIGCLAVFDGMMAVTLGALRGTGDVWMPCVMQSIAFWLIGLPIAYYLSVNLEYGIIGLWYGLGSGIFISLLLLVPRFYMISSKPIVRL